MSFYLSLAVFAATEEKKEVISSRYLFLLSIFPNPPCVSGYVALSRRPPISSFSSSSSSSSSPFFSGYLYACCRNGADKKNRNERERERLPFALFSGHFAHKDFRVHVENASLANSYKSQTSTSVLPIDNTQSSSRRVVPRVSIFCCSRNIPSSASSRIRALVSARKKNKCGSEIGSAIQPCKRFC